MRYSKRYFRVREAFSLSSVEIHWDLHGISIIHPDDSRIEIEGPHKVDFFVTVSSSDSISSFNSVGLVGVGGGVARAFASSAVPRLRDSVPGAGIILRKIKYVTL